MSNVIDPAELTPLQARRRLRAWSAGMDAHVHAAVELLIAHETWLCRRDFLTAAVRVRQPAVAWINWRDAREAFDAGCFDQSSSTERAVLDLAIALGEDRYRLSAMGHGNGALVATSLALAAGLVTPAPTRGRPVFDAPQPRGHVPEEP
jgi:predicted esterase